MLGLSTSVGLHVFLRYNIIFQSSGNYHTDMHKILNYNRNKLDFMEGNVLSCESCVASLGYQPSQVMFEILLYQNFLSDEFNNVLLYFLTNIN